MKIWKSVLATSLCSIAFVTSTSLAQVNDECPNASAIAGPGSYGFDLTNATNSVSGPFAFCGGPAATPIAKDVWFCWTSGCNGLVEFSTCGQTNADTIIRIYQGCTCPSKIGNPICCGDDECGLQTRVVCDATCGQTYLIQVGVKPGSAGAPGKIVITCLEGICTTGGGLGGPPADCTCCGGVFNFKRPGDQPLLGVCVERELPRGSDTAKGKGVQLVLVCAFACGSVPRVSSNQPRRSRYSGVGDSEGFAAHGCSAKINLSLRGCNARSRGLPSSCGSPHSSEQLS